MASNGRTSNSKRGSQKEGDGNPEVMFFFRISPNMVETIESFKVQLFNTNNHEFVRLIHSQLYTESRIHKEGNNEVRFNNNCDMYNTTPLRITPGAVQGQRAMGAGVVFVTGESSIIISSPRSRAEDSKKLAKKHEAIGRIVSDNSSGIDGTAIQHILSALESSPPKSLSIVNCYLVT